MKVRAGGGLAKSWRQKLRIEGKPCNLDLGRYPIVTLADARAQALKMIERNRQSLTRGLHRQRPGEHARCRVACASCTGAGSAARKP